MSTTPVITEALEAVGIVCRRYQITALGGFIESCRSFAEEKLLNVAVLGRFKTGKSSFLNDLIGHAVLPVGVVPVTSIVTEVQYGPQERSEIRFLDGHAETVPVAQIAEFISEAGNPGNSKRVALVRVEAPSMKPYSGIRFVDTPGLESVLDHNTATSMEWLPNVGLALVAVAADVPLSQHDIDLLRNLSRYTPNISLLLTKVDVLNAEQQGEVMHFVTGQLDRHLKFPVPIFPYSVRPGFETLLPQLRENLLAHVQAGAGEQRASILRRKVESLLNECTDYLKVALKSAEIADSERNALRVKILGRKGSLDDARLTLRLIVHHAADEMRPKLEGLLREHEAELQCRLLAGLDEQFPGWTHSLRFAAESFDHWLRASVIDEIAELSRKRHNDFIDPVRRVSSQLSQALQDFRSRISERTQETLGVSLRTTEMDLRIEEPRAPDVRIGKIFDRNWELLSSVAPMMLLKRALKKHFERKVRNVVFVNLARLASQWEEILNAALRALEQESIRRLEVFIETIGKVTAVRGQEAPRIHADLQRLDELKSRLSR